MLELTLWVDHSTYAPYRTYGNSNYDLFRRIVVQCWNRKEDKHWSSIPAVLDLKKYSSLPAVDKVTTIADEVDILQWNQKLIESIEDTQFYEFLQRLIFPFAPPAHVHRTVAHVNEKADYMLIVYRTNSVEKPVFQDFDIDNVLHKISELRLAIKIARNRWPDHDGDWGKYSYFIH